jgi:fucose permease
MKPSIFRTPDGRNHAITFALVSSLFLLWGFCNGMIDVMDKQAAGVSPTYSHIILSFQLHP